MCAQTASEVLRLVLKPLCDAGRNSSIFLRTLLSVMVDNVFLNAVSSTISRKLLSSPRGLPAFWRTVIVPLPRPRLEFCSKALLSTDAISSCSELGPYLSSSPGMLSGPAALLLFSLDVARATSSIEMGIFSCLASSAGSGTACWSYSLASK